MSPLATRRADPLVTNINVDSIVDILMVLLILFMLTGMGRMVLMLHLPASVHGPAGHDQGNAIVLALPDGGRYLLNDVDVSRDELRGRLREIYDGRPAKLLFMSSGRHRPYRDFIAAADEAREAGVRVIAVALSSARR